MKTIYIDVLLILNVYVNFFLLKATARITHSPLKTKRCVLAALIGSFSSLTILLPTLNFTVNTIIKLTAAYLITTIAFGFKNAKNSLKLLMWFYLVNFIFGGIVMGFYNFFQPEFMTFSNSSLYIDFSLLSLIVFTAAAYFMVMLVRYLFDKGCDTKRKYRISIRRSKSVCTLNAIADTGNCLVDAFTGKPVIVCHRAEIAPLISFEGIISPENAELITKHSGIRFIPFSTVSDGGLIPVFTPEETVIIDEENGNIKKVDVLIGISENDIPAVFNPGILC